MTTERRGIRPGRRADTGVEKIPLFDRFMAKLSIPEDCPDPVNACWTWVGATTPGRQGRRYGHMSVVQPSGGRKVMKAHHVALILDGRPRPFVAAQARHLCPLPPGAPKNYLCCNWNHLDWGTQAENQADNKVQE